MRLAEILATIRRWTSNKDFNDIMTGLVIQSTGMINFNFGFTPSKVVCLGDYLLSAVIMKYIGN
jgi:hypothetical protein